MSVLNFLEDTASAVKIADWERTAIDTSIDNLSYKLGRHFNNLHSKFVFGSYDRKTILRRSKDPRSDVDYMVVFNDGDQYQPQTLMTRLKTFAEANYARNEIYQSSPTIIIELSNIMFELAPAKISWGTLYIPAPASAYVDWISTNPQTMKTNLDNKHRDNHYQIKDVVMLLKYWNVKNGKVYTSYDLENGVINQWFFGCTNLKDYFYACVNGLSIAGLSIANTAKVTRLKEIVTRTKAFEAANRLADAEEEIKKAFQ